MTRRAAIAVFVLAPLLPAYPQQAAKPDEARVEAAIRKGVAWLREGGIRVGRANQARELVLLATAHRCGVRDHVAIADAESDRRVLAEVLHPIAPIAPAREEVDAALEEREPDLDGVGAARPTPGGGHVTVVERGELRLVHP